MKLSNLFNRLRSRLSAMIHDVVMIPVAWIAAYLLRFNLGPVPEVYLAQALTVLPLVVIIQSAAFWYFGLYRGVWRFASVPDLMRILKAIATGVLVSAAVIFVWTRMQDVPRSIFPLYGLILILLLGGPRMIYRWVKERALYASVTKRALIVGAGRAGEMLVRDVLRDQGQELTDPPPDQPHL